jgi:hypothetical protein
MENRAKDEEESKQQYMAKFGINWLEYEAVYRANRETLATTLPGGGRRGPPDLGSFINQKDERQVRAGMSVNLEQKKVKSMSFDANTLECRACSGHEGEHVWVRKGGGLTA